MVLASEILWEMMHWITSDDALKWIVAHGQLEDPYRDGSKSGLRIQFYAPTHYLAIEHFVRCCLTEILADSDEFLVLLTDWEPTEPCRDMVLNALRASTGEARSITQAPACIVSKDDPESAIALFALVVSFKWKAYLYGTYNQTVLYNWEGEIFDVWTDSPDLARALRTILQNFKLREVSV